MKKILCLCVAIVMLFATSSMASAVRMYSLDGRTLDVDNSLVDAYRAVGWYNGPIVTMYALDGRTAYVGANDVPAWRAVGWYNGPIVTMYALDGRTAYVGADDVPEWKAVGWFIGPITTLYHPLFGAEIFSADEVDSAIEFGYFRTKAQADKADRENIYSKMPLGKG